MGNGNDAPSGTLEKRVTFLGLYEMQLQISIKANIDVSWL